MGSTTSVHSAAWCPRAVWISAQCWGCWACPVRTLQWAHCTNALNPIQASSRCGSLFTWRYTVAPRYWQCEMWCLCSAGYGASSLLCTAEHKPSPRAFWSQEAAHPCLLSFCKANRLSYCGAFLLLSAKSLNVPAPVGGISIFKDCLVSACKYTACIPGWRYSWNTLVWTLQWAIFYSRIMGLCPI